MLNYLMVYDLLETMLSKKMNYFKLSRNVLADREMAIRWSIANGLLPANKTCPLCSNNMNFDIDAYSIGRFRCKKRAQHRNKKEVELSAAEGSWFSGAKLPIQIVILLMYQFCKGATYEECIHECNIFEDAIKLSSSTISDWFSCCREVCMLALNDGLFETDGLLGGPGCVVEIDESKIGERKPNRGRMVEGTWILGMIDVTNNNLGSFRIEICEDNKRDVDTLIPLIRKHVAPGTLIRSEYWKAYIRLEDHGYTHETGEHTKHGDEASWRVVKRRLARGGLRTEDTTMHLCEYLFKKSVKSSGLHVFEEFIRAVSKLY